MKKPEIVYCIETFTGELISHDVDGPLVFPEAKDAQAYVEKRDRGGNKLCVAKVNARERQGRGFTDFGVRVEEGLKPPHGGMWMRAYRDMDQADFAKWRSAHLSDADLPDDIETLRSMCDDEEVKWHPRHKETTLKRLIREARSSSAAAAPA